MANPSSKIAASVVIVSYNTREKLRRCLECLSDVEQVIVVDNQSSDGSADMIETSFPGVTLVRNSDNRGFGAANNQGSDIAKCELVLYLNSDAYAKPGAIEKMVSSFADPAVIAVGGKLLNPDGSLQNSTAGRLTLWAVFCEQTYLERWFPRSGVFSSYWNTERLVALGGVQETEQAMGASLMVRRGVERFDERFFLYCEDTDLCLRLRRHGKILFIPDAEFIHDLGSSSGGNRWKAVARYNRGKELYFRIHSGVAAMMACFLIDRFGAALRFAVWSLGTAITLGSVKRYRDQAILFWSVLAAHPSGPTR